MAGADRSVGPPAILRVFSQKADFFQDFRLPGETPCVYAVYMNKHSWVTLSQADPRPLYLQVIEQIQRRVAVGDLPAGTELPSIRQLAADLNVSVITIKRAYLELEHAGTIVTRQGKGSVVSDTPGLQSTIQERELEEHLKEVAGLGQLLGLSKTGLLQRLADSWDRSQGKRK
jgi:GntR family transcriptional regulator